jgi:hypothetical protein
MQPANQDRPPLKTITQSGIFHLKLSKPKVEKVRVWDDGTMSARLFFVDVNGNCLSQSYGTKYGKSLAMLVGKMSGTYTSEFAGQTPEDYVAYVSKAAGKVVETSVEVTRGQDRPDGTPSYKYKLQWAKKGQTLTPPDTF